MFIYHYLVFVSISILYIAAPGPAVFLAINRGAVHGVKKSSLTLLGNSTGLAIMAFISAVGIGAIITNSPILMQVVKIVGALFLLYLGIKMVVLANKVKLLSSTGQVHASSKSSFSFYKDGVILALSNPKPIIFFTSIYPQFISYGAHQSVQFFILGASFSILSFFLLSSYVVISRHTFGRLMTQKRIIVFNWISGLLLIAIAMVLILSKL